MSTPLNNPLPEGSRFPDGTPALGTLGNRAVSLERPQFLQCFSSGVPPPPNTHTHRATCTRSTDPETLSYTVT